MQNAYWRSYANQRTAHPRLSRPLDVSYWPITARLREAFEYSVIFLMEKVDDNVAYLSEEDEPQLV
jgi:hypothetical protein